VVRRELAGIPRVEVAGVSKDKVEELFWDTVHPGQGRVGWRTQEITAAAACEKWKETGIATRLCRPDPP